MLERFYNAREFSVLKGKRLTAVSGLHEGGHDVTFECSDGTAYRMYHQQDDCEVVYLSKAERVETFVFPLTNEDALTAEERRIKRLTDVLLFSPIILAERIELDRQYLSKGADEYSVTGQQKTIFLLATANGVIALTWTGLSDDQNESTEIDFVQTAGEGLWKETTA